MRVLAHPTKPTWSVRIPTDPGLWGFPWSQSLCLYGHGRKRSDRARIATSMKASSTQARSMT
jgi:hypothetical protein